MEREARRRQGDGRQGRQGEVRVRHRQEPGHCQEPEGPSAADHR